jgi:hypothetical protein
MADGAQFCAAIASAFEVPIPCSSNLKCLALQALEGASPFPKLQDNVLFLPLSFLAIETLF